MNRVTIAAITLVAVLSVGNISRGDNAPAVAGAPAAAGAPATAAPEMKLPPGWTMDDMKACMDAGTPGKMQEFLNSGAGTWSVKMQQWMAPGTEPMTMDAKAVLTPIMEGRFLRVEWSGEMPGMGPFTGQGTYGYDNVAKTFQGTWIDSMSTGIMTGTGTLSEDQKTLVWNMSFNCPLTKKCVPMREVHTLTSPDSRTMEIFTTDPKSGKEYKMLHAELTRQPK